MGSASRGGSCPLCGNYASLTAAGKLYRHKGDDRMLASARRLECRASGVRRDVAERLRANKDAGRHPHRCEDGTWLYVCGRCGREAKPWPIERDNRCVPARWTHYVRPLLQLPTTEARNEE
ncbi:hypothetical protein, partial [Streptomyces sp. NPDC001781]